MTGNELLEELQRHPQSRTKEIIIWDAQNARFYELGAVLVNPNGEFVFYMKEDWERKNV